jgi:hypothetical protein
MIPGRATRSIIGHEGAELFAGEVHAICAVFDVLCLTTAHKITVLVKIGDAARTGVGVVGTLATEITAKASFM